MFRNIILVLGGMANAGCEQECECGCPSSVANFFAEEAGIDWSSATVLFAWCDVVDWSQLRATCSKASSLRWPRSVCEIRVSGRVMTWRAWAANLRRTSSRRRALLAACAAICEHSDALSALTSVLPLLEASALFEEDAEVLDLCVEAVRRIAAAGAAQALVDAGLAYRAATVLELKEHPGLVSCLMIVLRTARLDCAETARLATALLDVSSLDATLALETLVRKARDPAGESARLPTAMFDALGSPRALETFARLARRDPGSRQAQSALFVVNCLCDFGSSRLVASGDSRYSACRCDVVTAVCNNLYADKPSAFAAWPSCAALALEVVCKLAHLGLDECVSRPFPSSRDYGAWQVRRLRRPRRGFAAGRRIRGHRRPRRTTRRSHHHHASIRDECAQVPSPQRSRADHPRGRP